MFFLSCGGGSGEQKPTLGLRLLGGVDAPYFTKVWVRVSGYELEPRELTKEGIFYPGERVVFELDLPEGKERLVEALVYDHRGVPVYYGWGFYHLAKNSVAVVELKPCITQVSAQEVFLDKNLPTEGDFFLLNAEGLRVNFTSRAPSSLCLGGAIVAYSTAKGWRLNYIENPAPTTLRLERLYSVETSLPAGVSLLDVYGSVRSTFRGGSLELLSSRITSNKEPILAGYDRNGRLYLFRNGGFQRACGECRSLELITPEGFSATLWGERYGIFLPLQQGELYPPSEGFNYYANIEGYVKEPCVFFYSEMFPLKDFGGSARIEPKRRSLFVEGIKPEAKIKVYSIDGQYTTEGVCNSFSGRLFINQLVDRELWFEVVYPDGRFYGFLLKPTQESLKVFEEKLEVEDFRLEKNRLYLKVSKSSNLVACSLELAWDGGSLYLDRMPGSYIRLDAGLFGIKDIKSYRLVCYSKEGNYYAGLLWGKLQEPAVAGVFHSILPHK